MTESNSVKGIAINAGSLLAKRLKSNIGPITPICVTAQEHITYTPPVVLHGGVLVLRLTLLMHCK